MILLFQPALKIKEIIILGVSLDYVDSTFQRILLLIIYAVISLIYIKLVNIEFTDQMNYNYLKLSEHIKLAEKTRDKITKENDTNKQMKERFNIEIDEISKEVQVLSNK